MKNLFRLMLVIAGCLYLGYTAADAKDKILKHGLQTWNLNTQTWGREPLGTDGKIFVIDANGDPVPAVAFSHAEDWSELLFVPVDEEEQYYQKWLKEGSIPQPPVIDPGKTVVN